MRPTEMNRDTLLSRRELADTGICSYDKLAQDACKGVGIPHYKVGKKCIYRWGDVLDYLESNRVATTHENSQVDQRMQYFNELQKVVFDQCFKKNTALSLALQDFLCYVAVEIIEHNGESYETAQDYLRDISSGALAQLDIYHHCEDDHTTTNSDERF